MLLAIRFYGKKVKGMSTRQKSKYIQHSKVEWWNRWEVIYCNDLLKVMSISGGKSLGMVNWLLPAVLAASNTLPSNSSKDAAN